MNEYVSCRVASGQTRSEIIYEDAEVIGLMDICPIRPGHAQIIPREHFDYFEDLPDAIASRIIHLEQRLSRAMEALYGCRVWRSCSPVAITPTPMPMWRTAREDRRHIARLHYRRGGVCAF